MKYKSSVPLAILSAQIANQMAKRQYKYARRKRPAKRRRVATKRKVYKRKRKNTTKKLAKKVRVLARKVGATLSTHTNIKTDTNAYGCAANQQAYQNIIISSKDTLATAMSALRFYAPATPGTLTTADANTGTYSRKLVIRNQSVKTHIRNNYQIPCNIQIYLARVRTDTSLTPITTITSAKNDQFASTPTNPIGLYPSDCKELNELYHIKAVTGIRRVEPGKSFQIAYNSGRFTYDKSLVDSHPDTYQTNLKSCLWLIRIWGVPSHDSTSNYGLSNPSVDTHTVTRTVFEYDGGGTTLHDFSYDDDMDAQTTPLVSNCPVSDNQSLSTA